MRGAIVPVCLAFLVNMVEIILSGDFASIIPTELYGVRVECDLRQLLADQELKLS